MTLEEIYAKCRAYTMTSYERVKKLYEAVMLVNGAKLKGDFVECGVFKGGSVMVMAYTQLNYQEKKHIHLYDTFEGMTAPTESDIDYQGTSATILLRDPHYVCNFGIQGVVSNLQLTGYPTEFLHYHKGDVAKTLLDVPPPLISVLRLDTDWYESTKIELEVLYPALVPGGVLIIDDYGHFQGCKKAVDEYFKSVQIMPNFEQIDYTGVFHTKPSAASRCG